MKRFFMRQSRRSRVALVRGCNAGSRLFRIILRHVCAAFGYVSKISSKSGLKSSKHRVFDGYFGVQIPSETHKMQRLATFSRHITTLFGRVEMLPCKKVFFLTALLLFVDFFCFRVLASPKNAPNPPQTVTQANKGGSSDKMPAKASAKGATPLPDAASPNAPAPSAEPKEIEELKSYCESNPDDWAGFYNLGRQQYKLMDYNAAQQSFAQALRNCADPKEQEKIFYNLGNAGFRFSQSQSVDQQVLGFKESLQNYENALAINKEAKDTQHNIEVVKRYLKRAEQQQQQEQQNKKDDKKDNKNYTNMEKDNDSSDNKDEDKDKDKDDKDNQKDQQDGSGDKNVDLEQKEMDNILNRAKKVEKMLPPSSLNPQSGGKDPVIRDW